jgi:glycine cleavage system aminomethyltransferase T
MLNRPIGMGYVEPSCATLGTELTMTVRSQRHIATVVKLPFWKVPAAHPVLSAKTTPTLEQRR